MDNDAELRTYFDFDETDLNANRKGYLSRRQQARDKKAARSPKLLLEIAGFAFLVLAFVPIIFLINRHAATALWLIWAVWLVTWIYLAVMVLRMSTVDPATDKLKTVEGWVSTIKEEKSENHADKHFVYYWKVGGIKFEVTDPEKAGILEQGATYRLYYLDLGKQILSVERLPEKAAG